MLLSAAAKYIAPKQLLKDLQLVAKDATVGHLKDNELFKLYEYKLRNVPVSATVQFMRIVRMVEPYILPLMSLPLLFKENAMALSLIQRLNIYMTNFQLRISFCFSQPSVNIIFVIAKIVRRGFPACYIFYNTEIIKHKRALSLHS